MADPSIMFQGGNAGDHFAQAFQQGMEDNRVTAVRNAMAVLARDPTNQGALAALAKADPPTAMQYQQRLAEQSKAALAEHQDSILKGAELFRAAKAANPTAPDDQVYAIAYQSAQQAGLPIADVPPPGDPRVPGYIKGLLTIADGLKPQAGDNPRFIPFQQGGGVLAVNPDGTSHMVVVPNAGDQAAGSPVAPTPPAEAVARLRTNPHEAAQFDDVFGPGAAARALGNGGQAATPSATFP